MIRYEVRQQNLSRAQALLAQLAGPPSDLVAAVAALREERALREQREERLRELERHRDWATASRPRAAFLVVAFGLACAVWRYAIHDAGPSVESMPPERMAFFLGVGVALVCAGVLLLRRFLFRTGVTRALVLG